MGLLSGLAKAGLAKKALSEARKPKNQQKLKSLLSSDKSKGKGKARSGRRR